MIKSNSLKPCFFFEPCSSLQVTITFHDGDLYRKNTHIILISLLVILKHMSLTSYKIWQKEKFNRITLPQKSMFNHATKMKNAFGIRWNVEWGTIPIWMYEVSIWVLSYPISKIPIERWSRLSLNVGISNGSSPLGRN